VENYQCLFGRQQQFARDSLEAKRKQSENITSSDFPFLMSSDKYFVRKFDRSVEGGRCRSKVILLPQQRKVRFQPKEFKVLKAHFENSVPKVEKATEERQPGYTLMPSFQVIFRCPRISPCRSARPGWRRSI
jgi:hypothetical protein